MDQRTTIRVQVPASSANLGPGFDALALALGLHLKCTLRKSGQGFPIRVTGAGDSEIPCNESNLIWRAFLRFAVPERAEENLELEIVNEIPLGRGLGSSAAAIVAGMALANEWLGLGRSRAQLIQAATEMEGHPDNVAAAVRGGLVVCCQTDDGSVLTANARFPKDVETVLVVPQYQLSTEAARAVLPALYSRQDAVFNLQRVALLLAALGEGRTELLAEALRDRLHQPWRAPLLPGFAEILKLHNIPGLLGVALSGAGPAVVAFCRSRSLEAGEAIVACFRRQNIEATALRLPIDEHGLVVERLPEPDAAVEAI